MEDTSVDGLGMKGLQGKGGRSSHRREENGSGDADSSTIDHALPSSASIAEWDTSQKEAEDFGESTATVVDATIAGPTTRGIPTDSLPPDQIDLLVPFPTNLPAQYKALVSQIETTKHPNYPFILRRVRLANEPLESLLRFWYGESGLID